MKIGTRVSWAWDIDTDTVYGHVTAVALGMTEVKWADGSGPTWHKTTTLREV